MTERHLAEAALDQWKEGILRQQTEYRENIRLWKEEVETALKKARRSVPATFTIDSYLGG